MEENGARPVDVLIIGSGPAGLSTALHLLQINPEWGQRMLVIEKEAHPRAKLCGGGVTRLGLQVLAELGLSFPIPIPHVNVEDIRIEYQSRTIHVRGKPQFTVFHRAEFDAFLAEQLLMRGGTIHQNEKVTKIVLDKAGATVHTDQDSYRARIVVGADGSKGVTRKLVNPRRGKSYVARTLELLAPSSETTPTFTGRYARFDFTHARHHLQGYLWDFPSRMHGQPFFNRGVYDTGLADTTTRPFLPELLKAFVMSYGDHPYNSPLQGHPIHLFTPLRRLAVPRLLLVGDAAGIDPMFGEGIGPSLAYGRSAAQAIQDAFQRQDFSLKDYRRWVLTSPLGAYLTWRWLVANLIYRLAGLPGFLHLFWSFAYLVNSLYPEPAPLYAE